MTGFELPVTARISVCIYKIKQYNNNNNNNNNDNDDNDNDNDNNNNNNDNFSSVHFFNLRVYFTLLCIILYLC